MVNVKNVLRFSPPVSLGNGIFLALSDVKRAGRTVGLAFIADGPDVALIGIPAADPEAVVEAIALVAAGFALRRLVVLEWDDRLIEVLTAYAAYAPQAVVVADRRVAAAIRNDVPLQVQPITGGNDAVLLPSGRSIGFVPSPFVFSPSALMAYDHATRTLFTNRLFEISWDRPVPATIAETVPAMREYCRMYAPSSEYLRPVLAAVARLDVESAVTRSGVVFGRSAVARFVADLSATEFFNSPRALGQPSDIRDFSHAALATQVLFKLVAAFGEENVLAVFADQDFPIVPHTLEIDPSVPDDYRVWQRLFDLVYAKRGSPWLAVAEPLVDKLVVLYGVAKPAAYQSGIAAAEKKATEFDAVKKDLETRVELLESRLSGTLEKLTRDPSTGVYNELFLREFLVGIVGSAGDKGTVGDLALLFVAIDDVARLIAKSTKATGDEAIRNFGYLLDRTRRPQDIVVKRNGPGYVICLTDGGAQVAQSVLAQLREDVRDASAFIEPLSVSAALVRLAERPRDENPAESVEAMLSVGDARLRSAIDRGPSAFVDERSRIEGIRAGRVLLVDDDPAALELLGALLRSQNYEVTSAADGLAALDAGLAKRFDFVVCERNVPKKDGFALRQELYAVASRAPAVFILTTYSKTRESVVRANLADIDFVLEKPIIFEEIDGIIRRVARRNGLSR